ncbi:cupin domain-containing protein [Cupriavidus sp. 2SB]|uniref:cupin domain-containing protein n=1 Tax=Cupriavidus sp. 2SB TaxID=2502199 RepID=UPI0014855456|nr:cupin domain-containing protein [Cupriavidus sp. 2SB]
MKDKNYCTAIEMIELGDATQWRPLAGFPGLETVLLRDDLDEVNRRGARTRLVRFAAGVETSASLVHPYWEEVLVISGDLSNKDARQEIGASHDRHTPLRYSLRPPGTPHGPFVSRGGCVLFEVQYFLAESRSSHEQGN